MRRIDCTLPDSALPDSTLPDSALPDSTLPDSTLRGGASTPPTLAWSDLALPSPWDAVVAALRPEGGPRPVQLAALRDCRLLESRRNLLVSAPTNAGKTLVGLLPLLEALRGGQNSAFLTPLKAIAHEQTEAWQASAGELGQALGITLRVRVTTGDQRLGSRSLAPQPPGKAELIVATPERFEAILRNPRHAAWIESLGAVSVDEAQLIASPRRGPTLEYLITSLLCLAAPPRITLLCEPLANANNVLAWLAPCDWARVSRRWPPLSLEVWAADAEEDANACVSAFARGALPCDDARLLVFVYRTQSAEKLARQLSQELGAAAGRDGAMAYHAQLATARRRKVRDAFVSGACRLVVTTTALALGVNLPATHVLIRDTLFHGAGRLEVSQLLQMAGRAGRGDRGGSAVVLLRPSDGWDPDELAAGFSNWRPRELASQFDRAASGSFAAGHRRGQVLENLAAPVLTALSRRAGSGATAAQLRQFFARSLGGAALAGRLDDILRWLSHSDRRLVYRDAQNSFQLTRLGACAARVSAPARLAAGVGQLLRDLLSADPSDCWLASWTPYDHAIVLWLLSPDPPRLRRHGKALARDVDLRLRDLGDDTPCLTRMGLLGAGPFAPDEILGSLGVSAAVEGAKGANLALRSGYLATFHALEFQSRCDRREEISLRWRDAWLWLLLGLAGMLDIGCFYHHLKEELSADRARVSRVKALLRRMRRQVFSARGALERAPPGL